MANAPQFVALLGGPPAYQLYRPSPPLQQKPSAGSRVAALPIPLEVLPDPSVLSPALGQAGAPAAVLPPLSAVQLALSAAAAYLAAGWPTRPRGWCRRDLLDVRQSPIQGLGLFAKVDIPAGTCLGAYPGRPRTPAAMVAKAASAPEARSYCFRTRACMMLDPTDAGGRPSAMPVPGLPWIPVDVALSYANEPPAGTAGPNVAVEDDPKDGNGVLFVTCADLEAGGEVFVDYGTSYDRSGYGT